MILERYHILNREGVVTNAQMERLYIVYIKKASKEEQVQVQVCIYLWM